MSGRLFWWLVFTFGGNVVVGLIRLAQDDVSDWPQTTRGTIAIGVVLSGLTLAALLFWRYQ